MTALAANTLKTHKIHDSQSLPVYESVTIYKGALVAVNAYGYAVPGADTSGLKIIGVAIDGADNSAGSSGDINVKIDVGKVYKMTCASADQTWVGTNAYVVDDQTVAQVATTTNDVYVGNIVGYISATQVWVFVTGAMSFLSSELTASIAELNYNDKASALGVQEASKTVTTDANVNMGIVKSTQLHIGVSGSEEQLLATPLEINRICDSSAKIVTTTANLTLTQALHANRIVIVNKADGCALVLPEATGTGDKYTVIFGTALTSSTHTITTADTTNADFVGHVTAIDADSAQVPESFHSLQATGNDVITLNMTTQGGVSPYADYYVLTDIAADVWEVEGKFIVPAGSEPATPFSTT